VILMPWSMIAMLLAGLGMVARWFVVRHRSAFADAWERPRSAGLATPRRIGGLSVRMAGSGDTVYVLLHGLGATSLSWGAGVEPLTQHGVVFAPDLLGWGGSLDTSSDGFTLTDHLDAIDESMALAGLTDHRLVIGGHSMGAMLALCLAERHLDRVDRLVTWGAPMHADIEATMAQIGWMPRLFAMDAKPAQLACRVMCKYRGAAARMAVVARPDIPNELARASVEHTWPSYRGSLRSLVIENDWRQPLATLAQAGVSTELQWGDEDNIGEPDTVAAFTNGMPSIKVVVVKGADHHLPFVNSATAVVETLTAPLRQP